MTKTILEKIEGTVYKSTLELKKRDRKHLETMGHITAAAKIENSIAGYVQALRDCGVITESERKALFIYYATI